MLSKFKNNPCVSVEIVDHDRLLFGKIPAAGDFCRPEVFGMREPDGHTARLPVPGAADFGFPPDEGPLTQGYVQNHHNEKPGHHPKGAPVGLVVVAQVGLGDQLLYYDIEHSARGKGEKPGEQ